MVRFLSNFVFLLFSISYIQPANALSCAYTPVEEVRKNAESVYLIVVKKVNVENREECFVSGKADIEVLKIYKGDVDVLSKINSLSFDFGGHHVWGPSCKDLENNVSEGQMLVIYSGAEPKLHISKGLCSTDIELRVDSLNTLEKIEKATPPIWEKGKTNKVKRFYFF